MGTSGRIIRWHISEGKEIESANILVTVATDTLYQEENRNGEVELYVESHDDAFVAKILKPSGDEQIKPGTPIAIMVDYEEEVSEASKTPVESVPTHSELMWQAFLKTKGDHKTCGG